MSINLQKGQRIDLTKGNANLNKIVIGLGWDEASQGGLFSRFKSSQAIDCDASVLMLTDDRLKDGRDLVYFGKLASDCKSVIHSGDNLTGEGDGDDEQLVVELNRIPSKFNRLVFVVNIYDCLNRKQDFGLISNAFIRITDPTTGAELVRYNLSDNYKGFTALIAGEIYRHGNEWKFAAIGDPTRDSNISQLCQRYK